MKKICLILVLFSSSIYSQNFSFGFDYSRLVTGKNYESVSIYTLEADFEFEKYNFSVGVDLSAFVGEINFKALNHPSTLINTFGEHSPTLRINIKYYPSLFNINSNEDIKPFILVELGKDLVKKSFGTYDSMIMFCEEDFSFTNTEYYYANIGIGSIFFPTQPVSIIFELKYQLSNPTITYEKPNCSDIFSSYADSYSTYTEKVNLNMLLGTLGFRINL